MLRSEDHGPVRFFSLARSYAGRIIRSSGVYYVDSMLKLQNKAVGMREEGRTTPEIVRALNAEQPLVKFFSGGEFSSLNLISGLLRDAGLPEPAAGATDRTADAPR